MRRPISRLLIASIGATWIATAAVVAACAQAPLAQTAPLVATLPTPVASVLTPVATIATAATLLDTPTPVASGPALEASPSPAIVAAVPTESPRLAATTRAMPVAPTPIPATALPPTVAATPNTPRPTSPPVVAINGVPRFSDVSKRTPADVVAYFQGTLPDYPGSGPAATLDFSPSDILETMDTAVLDQVQRSEGNAALQKVYDTIGRSILATIREEYGNQLVVVPVDAGHGGNKAYWWDPGSEGTEAIHTRAVLAALLRLDKSPENARTILRPIFNDNIAETFNMPGRLERQTVSSILIRQTRASMIAREAADWNAAHPEAPVAVHELSVHFNAGAGGALVLHEGDTVKPEYVARSVDFARLYLRRAIADLNATGLLPTPLRLWGGNGLHDDLMMYRPAYMNNNPQAVGIIPRYGELQGNGYAPRYIQTVLANHG